MSSPSFIKSALLEKDWPHHEGVEFAFIGASNSGKSSLINALIGADLCRTSSSPGKTREINFFKVRKGVVFVDLPGYGFAKRSKSEQETWRRSIEAYLAKREQLLLCYVLFDLKRGVLESDQNLFDWMEHIGVSYSAVATKIDKLNQKERSKALRDLKAQELEDVFQTSAIKKRGLDSIWDQIMASIELSASQD